MIRIVYDNLLLVDGRMLTRRDGPERLHETLVDHREEIVDAIGTMHDKYSRTAPEVRRGGIWVVRLATHHEAVIKKSALKRDARDKSQRNIFDDGDDLFARYRPFWSAIVDAGLVSEGRIEATPPTAEPGTYLLARDTPLE